jgi:membrane protein implicated in regulation of membrane protease activity
MTDMLSTQQIFWSIAIVSSVLLVILLVMTLFDTEEEPASSPDSAGAPWLDARLILLFFTLLGWFTVIGSYLELPLRQNVLFSVLLSFSLVFIPSLAAGFRRSPDQHDLASDLKGAILSTGQVLQPIPPHRNGFGKVQLDHRRLPMAMDAVTAGQEIRPGAPVRVVDVIDNRILVVEPLPEEIPPDGGMIRVKSE